MRNDRLEIRLPSALKEKFIKWCENQGTTPSDELRRYITKLTKKEDK